MRDAAKRDKRCEFQNPVHHRIFEGNLDGMVRKEKRREDVSGFSSSVMRDFQYVAVATVKQKQMET